MLQVPAIMGSLVIQDGYHFQPKKQITSLSLSLQQIN
jgi:hypothetical protein